MGGEGEHGDKAGVMGSCPLCLLFLGYNTSLPWFLWEARREQGLPQGCRGGSRGAPGWASLEGRVGVGFVHHVPGKGGPFLFYTINIHHLLCLTVRHAFHHRGTCPSLSLRAGESNIPSATTFPKETLGFTHPR